MTEQDWHECLIRRLAHEGGSVDGVTIPQTIEVMAQVLIALASEIREINRRVTLLDTPYGGLPRRNT